MSAKKMAGAINLYTVSGRMKICHTILKKIYNNMHQLKNGAYCIAQIEILKH